MCVYLCTKFQFCSIILTSLRHGGGGGGGGGVGVILPPPSFSKQTPIRVKRNMPMQFSLYINYKHIVYIYVNPYLVDQTHSYE